MHCCLHCWQLRAGAVPRCRVSPGRGWLQVEVRAPSPQPASAPASRGRASATAWGWHHRRSVLTPSPQSRAHRRGLSRLRLTLGDGPAAATLGALAATAAAAPTGMDVADGAPPAWRLYCYSTTPALCSQAAPHPRSVNSYPIGTSLSQMARIFKRARDGDHIGKPQERKAENRCFLHL